MNVLELLTFVLGSVNPVLAALWLAAAIGLAILLVYAWEHVFGERRR